MAKCSCGKRIINSSNNISFLTPEEQMGFNILVKTRGKLCRHCKYRLVYKFLDL